MPERRYAAGVHFVGATSMPSTARRERTALKRHAARATKPVRRSFDHKSLFCAMPSCHDCASHAITRIPRHVRGSFSGLQLAPGIEPGMIESLTDLLQLSKFGRYPYEICLQVHLHERGWFPYMLSDPCCIHSMLFSVCILQDGLSQGACSTAASMHYAHTLRILQTRLYAVDQASAVSDATIMVIVTLASIAEMMEDLQVAEVHVKGLERIVDLRGGLTALDTHLNMPVKVCRADLSYALLSGSRPRLFKEGLSWDCFMADQGPMPCSHLANPDLKHFFGQDDQVGPRLGNVLKDLHCFSCTSNLAFRTTRKLSPEIYNEALISLLYRLMHLEFAHDPLQEAVRLGALVYCTMLFMQRRLAKNRYDGLLARFENALSEARDLRLSDYMALWLTMVLQVASLDGRCLPSWTTARLRLVMLKLSIANWAQAREALTLIAWVYFLHENPGEQCLKKIDLYVDPK